MKHNIGNLCFDKKKPMTEARWKAIARCKEDFLNGTIEDPKTCGDVDPAIAASWKRCRNQNVDPFAKLRDLHPRYMGQKEQDLSPVDLELMILSRPLFDAFDRWTSVQRFDLTLDSVLSCRQLLKNDGFVSDPKWDISGAIQEENVIGTNAYALAKLLRHPVAVQGPEYYNKEFEDCFVAAAPIFTPDHDMAAILQIAMTGLMKMREPWKDDTQWLFSQLLGLCSSMATAIENKLGLSLANRTIESANALHETILSLIDDGIIVVNKKGEIISINKAAARYLKRNNQDVPNNFLSYLPPDSRLTQVLEKGEPADFEDTLKIGRFSKKFLLQARPLIQGEAPLCEGAVLSLKPAEKADKMAVLRTGNRAVITFKDIIGKSGAFQQALRKAELYSGLEENVLLCGESGTGKELFAQAIHNNYNPDGPFIALNCAAIPRDLIESELFGYERGSFTGADKEGRPGKIELAQNGTLFLDEIGDMPLELQAVLLRVLENKQVSRIGGLDSCHVNFRLISASNKDLKKMAENHQFRQDLYYRLSVLTIQIPPLRERENDIAILSSYFIEKCSKKIGCPPPAISAEAQKILSEYRWPGNVRQLENVMISCVYTMRGNILTPEELPNEITGFAKQEADIQQKTDAPRSANPAGHTSLKDAEKEVIEKTLADTGRHMTKTAQILGISVSTLYRKVREYNL